MLAAERRAGEDPAPWSAEDLASWASLRAGMSDYKGLREEGAQLQNDLIDARKATALVLLAWRLTLGAWAASLGCAWWLVARLRAEASDQRWRTRLALAASCLVGALAAILSWG